MSIPGRLSSRTAQWLFLVLSIGVALLVLVYAKSRLDIRVAHIRDDIIARVEKETGAKISYNSVSPALLTAVGLRGLEITFPQGSLRAEGLKVFYNPFRLIGAHGADAARIISRLYMYDGALSLTVPEGGQGSAILSKEDTAALRELLADKTAVLDNIRFEIQQGPGTLYSGRVSHLELKEEQLNIRYNLAAEGGMASADQDMAQLRAAISSHGSFSIENTGFNGRVDLIDLVTGGIRVKPMAVDVSYGAGVWDIRRIGDAVPLDVSCRVSSEGFVVSGETDGMQPVEIFSIDNTDRKPLPDALLNGFLDGSFYLAGTSGGTVADFDADLMYTLPELQNLQARVKARGNGGRAEVDMLEIRGDSGSARYEGSFSIPDMSPSGLLLVKLAPELLGYPVDAEFLASSKSEVIKIEPRKIRAGSAGFEDFRCLLIRDDQTFTASLRVVPEMPGNRHESLLLADLAVNTKRPEPEIHGFLSLKGIPGGWPLRLANLQAAENLTVFRDSLINVSGFVELNEQARIMSVESAELVSTSNPNNRITFSGRMLSDRITLDGLRMQWNDYTVSGRGTAEYRDNGGTIEGNIIAEDRMFPLSGYWNADGNLNLQCRGLFSFSLDSIQKRGPSFVLTAEAPEIPLKDGSLNVSVNARGQMQKKGWIIRIPAAEGELKRHSTGSSRKIKLSGGTLTPHSLSFTSIIYLDEHGPLTGYGRMSMDAPGSNVSGEFLLKSQEGSERYLAVFDRKNNIWDASLNIQNALMDRAGDKTPASGLLNMQGSLQGRLDNPSVTVNVRTEKGLLNNAPFDAQAELIVQDRIVRIQDVRVQYNAVKLRRGLLTYNMNTGKFRSTADIKAMFNKVSVASGFSLALDFPEPPSLDSLSELKFQAFTGTLATRPLRWDSREHLPAFTFQFQNTRDSFHMQSPRMSVLNLDYNRISNQIDVVSGSPLPVVVRGGGVAAPGHLDLSFPVVEMDPVLINYVMPRDPILQQYHVIFQEGRFAGNLDVKGSAENPLLYGDIRAENLQVDTPYTYAGIGTGSSTIHFRGNRIDVDRIEVPVGAGIVYGGGYLVMDRGNITDFDMVYGGKKTADSPGVPVYYPLMGVNMDGYFTGEVRMLGDSQSFFLSGDLHFPVLKMGLGTTVVPEPSPLRNPRPFYLDFNFITGNNCTFYLPNEQIKIVRATAEPNKALHFTYSSDPQSLSLTGKFPIKSGNINYFDREFQVTRGDLTFNETLSDFNPILSFRAETRVRDDVNEEITVALVYNAPIVSDFNPRVETIPPRKERDILALLGQSVVPYREDSDTESPESVFLGTGSLFAKAGLMNSFEDALRENLNLDMLTIRTDIIENALSGSFIQAGESSLSSGLGRYLDNTSLFAGKYIGNALFVSGSLSAKYFEGIRNRSAFGGLEFESSVIFEMETPLFDVIWSYSPSSSRKQNFVADNEISLKWQFSY